MSDDRQGLKPNAIAFLALCNEYCSAVEHAAETDRDEFLATMLRLLPRLYISGADLAMPDFEGDLYIDDALDEDYYDSMRRDMETLLGEDDTYLEVFEEDMKYSDTPIAVSAAETLADLFQVFFNLLETVKTAPSELIESALGAVREDFGHYWSQKLCNVLRSLNQIYYK